MTGRLLLRIPARVNILGNPTDANEGDFSTISGAINIYAGGTIEPADEYILQWIERDNCRVPIAEHRMKSPDSISYTDDDPMKIFKGVFRYLIREYPGTARRIKTKGLKFSIWTDVPRQSGLGGSSLPILLILRGLQKYYELEPDVFNIYAISEIAQRIEEKELGIICGFSDRYVPHFGGLAYIDYRGKLYHKPLNEEPYATYERLDSFVDPLEFIIVSSGVPHDSGDVHGIMRGRYLEDWDKVRYHGAEPSVLLKKFRLVGDTAWKGKIALLRSDHKEFGILMNENHRLVNEIMLECGFTDGAGEANNLFISTALSAGALGAKLSGAGGGGSVIILAEKAGENRVIDVIEKIAAKNKYGDARILKVSIDRNGLQVITESAERREQDKTK